MRLFLNSIKTTQQREQWRKWQRAGELPNSVSHAAVRFSHKAGPKVYTGAVSVLRMAYQPADMLMAAVFAPLVPPSALHRRPPPPPPPSSFRDILHPQRTRRWLVAIVVGGCRRARCSPLDRPLNVCMHVQLRMVEAGNENERQIEATGRPFAGLIVHFVGHRSCLIESFRERMSSTKIQSRVL